MLVGEGAGLVNVPTLKGIHYAIESGKLAAEAAFRALQPGENPGRVGALSSYDEELRRATSWTTCARCGTCARPSTRASTWVARSRAR